MKCHNCVYYKSGEQENECLAFDYYNFSTSGECDQVDENFNLITDEMGNKIFDKRKDTFDRIKNKWHKIDLTERYHELNNREDDTNE